MTRAATKLAVALLLAGGAGCGTTSTEVRAYYKGYADGKAAAIREVPLEMPMEVQPDTGGSPFLLYGGRVWRPDATPEQPR